MDYLRLETAKLHPFLKWVHFKGQHAWLDMTSPEIEMQIMLFGRDASGICINVLNNRGEEVSSDIHAITHGPENLRDFSDQAERNRQMLSVRFKFGDKGRHVLVDATSGDELLEFIPSTVYPDFLFRTIEELRAEFAPEGFANFVESGTLFGHTALHASYWFDNVTTIELSSALHQKAVRNLAHRPNVTCLEGNSGELLGDLVSELSGSTLFFLDGHWSGDNTVDWNDAGKFNGYPLETAIISDPKMSDTQRQKPLISELKAIAENSAGKTAVLMDDWVYLGTKDIGFKGLDWREIDPQKIIELIDRHPRTAFHAKIDSSRYLWCLAAK